MTLKDVKDSLLKNGAKLPITIEIEGMVSYCRIAKRVEGEELEKKNKERISKGWQPYSKPVYQLTLLNPTVLDDGRTDTNDAKNFLYQKISRTTDESGQSVTKFYAESKSSFAPSIVYGPQAGALAGRAISDRDNPLERELANGLHVTVGIKIFNANTGVKVGSGIDYVIVNEPQVRYYENTGGLQAALARRGVTYQGVQAEAPAVPENNSAMPQGGGWNPQDAQQSQSNGAFNGNAMNPPQENALGYNPGQAAGPFGNPAPASSAVGAEPAQKETAMPFGNNQLGGLTPPPQAGIKYNPQG